RAGNEHHVLVDQAAVAGVVVLNARRRQKDHHTAGRCRGLRGRCSAQRLAASEGSSLPVIRAREIEAMGAQRLAASEGSSLSSSTRSTVAAGSAQRLAASEGSSRGKPAHPLAQSEGLTPGAAGRRTLSYKQCERR